MATILDIAEIAGVSKSTVSRVFNNPGSVHPETMQKVMEAAASLHYTPNALARAMITKKTGNIGFIFYSSQKPIVNNPFYGPILESIIELTKKESYSLFISSDRDLKNDSGEIFLQKQVDGLILVSQTEREIAETFIKKNIPIVLINALLNLKGAFCILSDDAGGIHSLVDHLVSLGHREIGLVSGRFSPFIFNRRLNAFLEGMQKNRLTPRKEFMITTDPDIPSAYKTVIPFLKLKKKPSALICTNDAVAVGTMKAALSLGLKIPDDISITGYDNSELCYACEPPITSIDAHPGELGKHAVDKLLAQINGKPPGKRVITLDTSLIKRESTGIKKGKLVKEAVSKL